VPSSPVVVPISYKAPADVAVKVNVPEPNTYFRVPVPARLIPPEPIIPVMVILGLPEAKLRKHPVVEPVHAPAVMPCSVLLVPLIVAPTLKVQATALHELASKIAMSADVGTVVALPPPLVAVNQMFGVLVLSQVQGDDPLAQKANLFAAFATPGAQHASARRKRPKSLFMTRVLMALARI